MTLDFKYLNKTSLERYIHSSEFDESETIAISYHRARSQMQNPRLKEEDILLIMVYDQSRFIGYLGMMPEYFFIGENVVQGAWLTCLWIDPRYRGKKIAQQLLKKGSEVYNDCVLLTDFAVLSGILFRKTGFYTYYHDVVGIRYYIKSSLSIILPNKWPFFKRTQRLLRGFDSLINLGLDLMQKSKSMYKVGLNIFEVDEVDDALGQFIQKNSKNEFCRRGQNELNWMLKHPWIIPDIGVKVDHRYHFSAYARQFEVKGIKVTNEQNQVVLFLIYTVRDGHLKVPHIYFESENHVQKVLTYLIKKLKIHTCTLYAPLVLAGLNHRSISYVYKNMYRTYMISHGLEKMIGRSNIYFQDGDGDVAFT